MGWFMTDPVYSPDGKFMWTGSEWIPAPPQEEPATTPTASSGGIDLDMQDSVIGGDVVHKTVINNDPAAMTQAIISVINELGMFDSGSKATPATPPVEEVELPPSFQVGDHVEYYSPTNERWLDRCKVVGLNEDGTYRIEVPKSSGIETKHAVVIGTSPGTIRPASPPFNQGDRVIVDWKNYGTYFPGTIAEEHEDHTFLIHFDDGDVEDCVEWGRIEPLQEESTEVQDYVDSVVLAEKELIEAFEVFDEEGSGTISARKYFEILTEIGDEPIPVDEVLDEFISMGIDLDSDIDYRALARYMVSSTIEEETIEQKPMVIIRDAYISDGSLHGFAYAHPKLGDAQVRTSNIQNVTFDERATAHVETRNTMYVVGPTGWKDPPANHPFLNKYSVGDQIQVEWNGSWFDASILQINDDSHLITYTNYDSSWDEWVTTERIRNQG